MRIKDRWNAHVQTTCYARHSVHEFVIHALMDNDPDRYLNVSIPATDKDLARRLAKALMEWVEED